MSLTTVAENLSRFLAFFGFFLVLGLVGAGVYQAVLLDDVYDNIGPDQLDDEGTPDAAQISDPDVRGDLQDAMTIQGWIQPVGLLGLGSLLGGIILNFAVVIYRGVKTVTKVMPRFVQGYEAANRGTLEQLPGYSDENVQLPFGGGG